MARISNRRGGTPLGDPESLGTATARPDAELDHERLDADEELDDGGAGGGGSSAGGRRRRYGGGGDDGDDGGDSHPVPHSAPRRRSGLIGFAQGSWRELQRVQWPDQRQVVQATGVVLGFVIVAGAYLGLADWVAGKIINFIL